MLSLSLANLCRSPFPPMQFLASFALGVTERVGSKKVLLGEGG